MNRLAASLVLLGACAAATGADSPFQQAPEAKTGPYRIIIDRITHNPSTALTYNAPGSPRGLSVEARRSVQLQLAVFTPDRDAANRLATFQVSGVTAELGGRPTPLAHYGTMLDNPNETAVIRAYVFVPNFPNLAKEVRSVEGQIIAYERSSPLDVEVALGEGKPRDVETDRIKATLREYHLEGGTMQATIWLEGPPDSVLLNVASDGTYGVSLVDGRGRTLTPGAATLLNPRPNQAEYRVSFQNVQGDPERLRVHLLNRGGARKSFPFRFEHVPIPGRVHVSAAAEKAEKSDAPAATGK